MKLVHPDLQRQILPEKENACQWIIESPALFSKYVQELCKQTEGEDGDFVLSDGDKEIDISKYAEVIINPFAVNINDKKVIGKLYTELSDLAYGGEHYLRTQELLGTIQKYFLELEQSSPYMLEMNADIEISGLFKAIGVKMESYSDDFFSKLNQYIKVMAEILKKKLIILINIRSYVNEQQLMQLLENAVYNEVKLLLIESNQKSFSSNIPCYIIDVDQCEI